MKAFQFLFVGSPKKEPFKALENTYLKKISHYIKTDLSFVKDSNEKNIIKKNEKEGEALLQKIAPKAFVILCDEQGKTFTSNRFAEKLQSLLDAQDQIYFLVGGAYGFSDAVKKRANLILKIAPWTLPHELARVVLVEQVYRALSIARGERYHHE